MPVRDKFPREYFETNPLDGETPEGAYKRLQWGNSPRNKYRIEAPEPMAVLGELAKIVFLLGKKAEFDEGVYYVSVGIKSNMVYFVPMERGKPVDFPNNFLNRIELFQQVKQVDYYSEKGGEAGYYYHECEKPYPVLAGVGRHYVLVPAKHRGGRSYAVNDEGIIG